LILTRFFYVSSISDQLFADDASSSNITRLPLLMSMACQELKNLPVSSVETRAPREKSQQANPRTDRYLSYLYEQQGAMFSNYFCSYFTIFRTKLECLLNKAENTCKGRTLAYYENK